MRFSVLVVAAAGLAGPAACGQLAPSSPTPKPIASATPLSTPTPTPAPDTETVTVVGTGVGTWQLVTIPVAVVRNDAVRHGAEVVVVHFATRTSSGRALGSLDSEAVNLVPGETLAVAADCTDGCNSAASVAATVTVGLWTAASGPSFATTGVSYQCGTGACGGQHGEGHVMGTLETSGVGQGAAVVAFAACVDAGGAIVGGGVDQTVWQGGLSASVDVPVIVSRPPGSCRLGASTGW